MRDTEDLVGFRQGAHFLPHFHRDFPADVGVDLVEDEQRHAVLRGQHGLEREHDSRYLAARSDGAERLGRLARIRSEFEFSQLGTGELRFSQCFQPDGKSGA